MTKATKIVLGIVGGLFVLLVVLVSAGAYMVMSAFHTAQVSSQEATAEFDQARARFKGVEPAFTFDGGKPKLNRQPPATSSATPPTTVHVLVFDEHEGRMARIHLPMGLFKLGNSPIEFEDVRLEARDVERYGSTLLLDGDTPDGDPMLVWTD